MLLRALDNEAERALARSVREPELRNVAEGTIAGLGNVVAIRDLTGRIDWMARIEPGSDFSGGVRIYQSLEWLSRAYGGRFVDLFFVRSRIAGLLRRICPPEHPAWAVCPLPLDDPRNERALEIWCREIEDFFAGGSGREASAYVQGDPRIETAWRFSLLAPGQTILNLYSDRGNVRCERQFSARWKREDPIPWHVHVEIQTPGDPSEIRAGTLRAALEGGGLVVPSLDDWLDQWALVPEFDAGGEAAILLGVLPPSLGAPVEDLEP